MLVLLLAVHELAFKVIALINVLVLYYKDKLVLEPGLKDTKSTNYATGISHFFLCIKTKTT